MRLPSSWTLAKLGMYLEAEHSRPLVHFRYVQMSNTWLITYGPDKSEGITGKGTSIGAAIEDLIQQAVDNTAKMFTESNGTSEDMPDMR